MKVYLCEDSFEGILSGVCRALSQESSLAELRLEILGTKDAELFCQYEEVPVSSEAADSLSEKICRRISAFAWKRIYIASLSLDPERAQWIFRFICDGLHYGKRITEMLHLESVYALFRMCRFVENESHLLSGFLRFGETKEGVRMAVKAPKNDVLPLLADHFSNRMPEENWLIYDKGRRKAALHQMKTGWFILRQADLQENDQISWNTDQEEYQELWRIFHQSAAIRERENFRCQRTHLPLRYRPYMTEFS